MIEIRTLDTSHRGTIGALFVDGEYVCLTLELPWKNNEPNVSCMPSGVYEVELEFSPHFGAELYEVYGVDGRSEIKFHKGNYLSQIEGCVLVGRNIDLAGSYEIYNSKSALSDFMVAMDGRKEATLIVSNRPSI